MNLDEIKSFKMFLAITTLVFIELVLLFGLVYAVLYPVRYFEHINSASKHFSVDKTLVMAVVNTESHFRERSVSSAGAKGLMQLMPDTAEWLVKKPELESYNGQDLFEPEANIMIGTYYLSYLLNKFGNEQNALAAYNAGEGTVDNWLKNPRYSSEGRLLNIPYEETKNYVLKVERSKRIYNSRLRKLLY